ncbi:MAG: YetF domain-containing protein, partial [Enterococcus lemanii]
PEDFQLQPEQETLFAEIIMDGRILEKNLQSIGFDLNWLSKQLHQHGIHSHKDVFLAVCDRNQNISFYKKEDK